MTTAVTSRPLSVHDVARTDLPDAESAQLDARIRTVARTAARQANLPAPACRSIESQLHAAVGGLLQRDVVSVLAAGWQSSTAMRTAARASLASPGRREVVSLHSQEVSQTFRPAVQVFVDRWRLATLELAITVSLRLRDLAAAVSEGAVVDLDFGQCEVEVAIATAGEAQLLHRSTALNSNARLRLPHPIRLVSARNDR